jgi:adenine-specific DNA-methyltransferase
LSTNSPAIVYADPPYTNDQYSRYYHVYETIILYDYPTISGKARYRDGRFVSRFSLKAEVHQSILDLAARVSALGSDLILSYPENGLLKSSRSIIPSILSSTFKGGVDVIEIPSQHSTMGGSKGHAKQDVTEVLFVARA